MTAMVWVTRPASAGRVLADELAAVGIQSHIEPLIEIVPLQSQTAKQVYRQQMQGFGSVDTCIFISANAVQQWFAIATPAQKRAMQSKAVFAVGKATQDLLAAQGVNAMAPQRQASSEALLTLPELQTMNGRHAYIFRGIGGRGFLQQQLQQRGARVQHVEIYQRQAPKRLSATVLTLLATQQLAAVFIGSMETFENLINLYPDWPKPLCLVVPSERVQQGLAEQGYRHTVLSPSALNSDMVATTQAVLMKQNQA